jgi:hypothetical protein
VQPHRFTRAHPITGVLTPVWTRRQVAQMAGFGRYGLMTLESSKLIPPPEYGYHQGCPLWSLRQVVLVMGVVKWLRVWMKDKDKYSETMLHRRSTMCCKEWNDGHRKRLSNGNHRNARWLAQRLFGNG